MPDISGIFSNLQKFWDGHSRTFVNLMVTFGTVGLQQIFSSVVFRCPCQDDNRTTQDNCAYGMVFLLAPSVILFIIGFSMNPTTWKLLTGCFNRKQKRCRWRVICGMVMPCFVAPTAWISIALLEGKYFACAFTRKPYDKNCGYIYNERSPTEDKFTVEYHHNVARSQFYGWMVSGGAFTFGILAYACIRCFSSQFYLQREFMMMTKDIEWKEFKSIAAEKIKQKAKEDIERFINESRSWTDWGRITEFHRIDETYPDKEIRYYSSLQKWFGEDAENTSAAISTNPALSSEKNTSMTTIVTSNSNGASNNINAFEMHQVS